MGPEQSKSGQWGRGAQLNATKFAPPRSFAMQNSAYVKFYLRNRTFGRQFREIWQKYEC